ncbi:MAG: hypothetical protein EBE86_005620 [Hormoscilla sp. GUM202]|nr:hypothetical protein [Hormoscilla sp. GUM202]
MSALGRSPHRLREHRSVRRCQQVTTASHNLPGKEPVYAGASRWRSPSRMHEETRFCGKTGFLG